MEAKPVPLYPTPFSGGAKNLRSMPAGGENAEIAVSVRRFQRDAEKA